MPPKAGLPEVRKDNKGVPEVTIPKTAPPKTLVVQPLIKGDGPKVGAGDQITFDYAWYTWDGKLWRARTRGSPAPPNSPSCSRGCARDW